MADTQPIIDVRNLYKHYGEHHVNALKGISLSIQAGEFVALMGPSGCGKSTLLNILGTIDRPTEGEVLIRGEAVFQQDEKTLTRFRRQQLGFIFQFFNLLTTLTVRENVALPLDLDPSLSESERSNAVSTMLERVGMSHRADFFPAQLSGGEMQRVAIARALVHQPHIILADEPTGNLDTENGEAVLQLLKSLSQEGGQVILMATHSEEAAAYANRIIRMRDGKIRPGA
ncbi:MAG: efflux transporter, ATP-binding protein [Vampirovibrio sp.]|jgi:putative ABC transport system ATP-binding protein|nr:efflux transporter, ATP-binding protein [Vampirovibrio sp.]